MDKESDKVEVMHSTPIPNRPLAENNMSSLLSNCSCVIYPPEAEEDNKYQDSLFRVILDHGGQVEKLAGPNSITLLDLYYMRDKDLKVSPKDKLPKHDIYTSRFIYEAIETKQLTDLNQCRFLHSNFEDYDANDILLGRRTWDSLIPLTLAEKAKAALRRKAIVMAKHKTGLGATVPNNVTTPTLLAHPPHKRLLETSTGENLDFDCRAHEDTKVPLGVWTNLEIAKGDVDFERTVDPVAQTRSVFTDSPPDTPTAQQVHPQCPSQRERGATPAQRAKQQATNKREGSVSPIEDILDPDHDIGDSSPSSPDDERSSRRRKAPDTKADFLPLRTPYSYEEDKKILQILMDNDWYESTSALEPYKWMEKHSGLRRTHQSLCNRVRKTVMKNLQIYDLPEIEIQKFKEGKRKGK